MIYLKQFFLISTDIYYRKTLLRRWLPNQKNSSFSIVISVGLKTGVFIKKKCYSYVTCFTKDAPTNL